jgi:hypothetical protein
MEVQPFGLPNKFNYDQVPWAEMTKALGMEIK